MEPATLEAYRSHFGQVQPAPKGYRPPPPKPVPAKPARQERQGGVRLAKLLRAAL
jgi:hypothetical protein